MDDRERVEGIRKIIEEFSNLEGQDLCHDHSELLEKIGIYLDMNLPTKKLDGLQRFREGCLRYQRKLYGCLTELEDYII